MNISENLFDKFKKIISGGDVLKKQFIVIVKDVAGLEMREDECSIRNGIVWITGTQSLKSELFMRKKALLETLSKEKIPITDIRY